MIKSLYLCTLHVTHLILTEFWRPSPFQLLLHRDVVKSASSFSGLPLFTLYSDHIILSAKQGDIKYRLLAGPDLELNPGHQVHWKTLRAICCLELNLNDN